MVTAATPLLSAGVSRRLRFLAAQKCRPMPLTARGETRARRVGAG